MLAELPAGDGSVTALAARSVTSELTRVAPVRVKESLPRRVHAIWRLTLLPAALVLAMMSLVVYFHASASPDTVRVPNLVSVGRESAAQVARSLALRPRIVWSYSSAVPAGLVISQRPAGRSRVVKGTALTLVVSKGPAPVAVPDVQGLKEDAGLRSLRASGFRVQIRTADTIFQSAGLVLDQSPPPGTVRVPGSAVIITVSQKPWWWIF